MKRYQDINSEVIDKWCKDGWEWGQPISHEAFMKAKKGTWDVVLTPTVPVPHSWFPPFPDLKILGLASGGGQQMPIFAALGAKCTVLDYSLEQLKSEEMVAQREGYKINIVHADMSQPLPFADEEFDLIFHPVSNCYIKDVKALFKEIYRVLRKGGLLLGGFDNGINYLFDDEEKVLTHKLPFDPTTDPELYKKSLENDWGIQFSHTLEEQIGGQLEAGLTLTHLYEDTNSSGNLHDFNIKTFIATRSRK